MYKIACEYNPPHQPYIVYHTVWSKNECKLSELKKWGGPSRIQRILPWLNVFRFSRFIPTSDTASGVQSPESITRLHCCTSSSRTSDKPFYTLTFPFLASFPTLPASSIYLNLQLFLFHLILWCVQFKLCQTLSHLKSCCQFYTCKSISASINRHKIHTLVESLN